MMVKVLIEFKDGTKVIMPLDEAQILYEQFKQLFEPNSIPICPYPYPSPYPYPTITVSTTSGDTA